MHQFPGFHPGFILGGISVVPITLIEEIVASRVLANVQHEITLPSGIEVGDLGIIWHRGTNVSSPPATVTPSGFSVAHNFTWTEGGLGMRNTLHYKLMDGTEDGETLDTANNLARFHLFRANRPFRSVSAAGAQESRSTGNPAGITIGASASTEATLAYATYWITGNGTIDPRVMVPDKDAEWHAGFSINDQAAAWRAMMKGTATDVSADMADESNRNWVTGVYFILD